MLEVNRTSRQHRRRYGKHDAGDAEAAARAVISGTASGEPKGADGAAESLRALRVARRSAVKARTQAANQLHGLLSTAPERLREELRGLPARQLAQRAARFRRGAGPCEDPASATKFALRSVARRYRALSEEIAELDEEIEWLVGEAAPELMALDGVGPDTAATLLIAAGDNPERLKSEASFANLCGAAPVPASFGQGGALPPQPWRQPRRQPCPARRGPQPPQTRPANLGVPRPAHLRGQDQEGGHAVSQALHRPRDLPRDPIECRDSRPAGLTQIGARGLRRSAPE